jgi:hypothetical protein
MTVYTYSKPVSHGEPSGVVVFSDKLCRFPAPVFSAAGVPLPGSKLDKDASGEWPQFTSTVAPVYVRGGNGTVVSISPQLSFAAPLTVTGSKAGNAALASLITQLIAAGIPIVDSTS